MKKISIIILFFAAITAFGFVSNSSQDSELSDNKTIEKVVPITGAEKSGFTESNQNW